MTWLDNPKYKMPILFLMGGLTVSACAYLASISEPMWAGVLSQAPKVTCLSFIIISVLSGHKAARSYTKNILWFRWAFIVYLLAAAATIIYGPIVANIAGLIAFLVIAEITVKRKEIKAGCQRFFHGHGHH